MPASFAREGHTMFTPWLSPIALPILFALPHWLCGSFPWPQRHIRVKCHHVPFSETQINTLVHSCGNRAETKATMGTKAKGTKVSFLGPINWTGFITDNDLGSGIRYANALPSVIICIGTPQPRPIARQWLTGQMWHLPPKVTLDPALIFALNITWNWMFLKSKIYTVTQFTTIIQTFTMHLNEFQVDLMTFCSPILVILPCFRSSCYNIFFQLSALKLTRNNCHPD